MTTKQTQQLENFWTGFLEENYARNMKVIANVSTIALFGLVSKQLDQFRKNLTSAGVSRMS